MSKKRFDECMDNCNPVSITDEFGTPLYVYSESRIRYKASSLIKAFKQRYEKFSVYYAVKANSNPALIKILLSEGCGCDVSSKGEMIIAKNAGVKDVLFTGAYVSEEDIRYALDNNVPINIGELSALDKLLRIGCPEFLSFRVNLGIGKGAHEGLITGGSEAKFGIKKEQVVDAYRKAKNAGVKRFGIHTMAGSGILDGEYFSEIVEKLTEVAGEIVKKLEIKFDLVDIGGGFGIPYNNEKELDIDSVAERVCKKFKEKIKEYDLGTPVLAIEPGKYLVGDSGVLLTKVRGINNSFKKFVGVDAGMNTMLRPAMYDAHHEIILVGDDRTKTKKVDIVGPVCESTDTFAKDRLLPEMVEGDLLAIMDVGAYGFSMSSQYNGFPRCAEVLVCNGKFRLIREKESFEDLTRGVK